MIKKLSNITILLGMIAGFPGVIDAVTPQAVKRVQQSKATRKWQKKIERIRRKEVASYLQDHAGIKLEVQQLTSKNCRSLFGADAPRVGLQAILVTIDNYADQSVIIDGAHISLPLLDEYNVLSQLHGDISYLQAAMLLSCFGIPAMPVVMLGLLHYEWNINSLGTLATTINPYYVFGSLLIAIPALFVAQLLTVGIVSGLLMLPYLFSWIIAGIATRSYQVFDNKIFDIIMCKQDAYLIEPGSRLDKIIFVPEETDVHTFTIKLQNDQGAVPFLVTL
jgi:hypothetical protein